MEMPLHIIITILSAVQPYHHADGFCQLCPRNSCRIWTGYSWQMQSSADERKTLAVSIQLTIFIRIATTFVILAKPLILFKTTFCRRYNLTLKVFLFVRAHLVGSSTSLLPGLSVSLLVSRSVCLLQFRAPIGTFVLFSFMWVKYNYRISDCTERLLWLTELLEAPSSFSIAPETSRSGLLQARQDILTDFPTR